ncbi:hypothetical protein [Pasteuria penetrans]|uniref:hypothetical protein n=1 Tax=Pasteuria penetrans TaxID=86005 RepID=UPI000FAD8495|nr:hypothetical protein [Pasteuria penetrans]
MGGVRIDSGPSLGERIRVEVLSVVWRRVSAGSRPAGAVVFWMCYRGGGPVFSFGVRVSPLNP